MVAIPAGYHDLLERPLHGHLATTRPDGSVQVSPIWFDWDGELLRFAHTTKRQKYRNVQRDPRVAMSISDPDNPYDVVGASPQMLAKARRQQIVTPAEHLDHDPAATSLSTPWSPTAPPTRSPSWPNWLGRLA
jgi:hypothetical protein